MRLVARRICRKRRTVSRLESKLVRYDDGSRCFGLVTNSVRHSAGDRTIEMTLDVRQLDSSRADRGSGFAPWSMGRWSRSDHRRPGVGCWCDRSGHCTFGRAFQSVDFVGVGLTLRPGSSSQAADVALVQICGLATIRAEQSIADDAFTYRVDRENDRVTIHLAKSSRCSAQWRPQLKLSPARPQHHRSRQVTFLDSTGLRVLVAAQANFADDGGASPGQPSVSVSRILEITGLGQTLLADG
jgi:hypothetical protein